MDFTEQIQLARNGDRQAVERLLLEWRPWMRNRARGMLGEGQAARVDSSDVVQIAMAEAFQNLPKFRGCSRPEWAAWLQGILRGQAIRIRRYNAAEMRRTGRELDGSWSFQDGCETPASLVDQQERRDRLQLAFSSLPQSLQKVVQRRIFDEASFELIGRELGQSPRTIQRHFSQAIQTLARTLNEPPGA